MTAVAFGGAMTGAFAGAMTVGGAMAATAAGLAAVEMIALEEADDVEIGRQTVAGRGRGANVAVDRTDRFCTAVLANVVAYVVGRGACIGRAPVIGEEVTEQAPRVLGVAVIGEIGISAKPRQTSSSESS